VKRSSRPIGAHLHLLCRGGLAAVVVGATLAVAPVAALAQAAPPPERAQDVARGTAAVERATGGASRVAVHARTGLARFVGTTRARPIPRSSGSGPGSSPEVQARAFLGAYGEMFGIADPAAQLRTEARSGGDPRSTRFQQLHKGVPVLGGELSVQVDEDGDVLTAAGEIAPDLTPDVVPSLDAAAAEREALAAAAKAHGTGGAVTEGAEAWIYDPDLLGGPATGEPRLVWRVTVASDDGEPYRDLVLVDAHTGGIALTIAELETAKDRQVCDRNNVVGAAEACGSPYSRSEGQAATGNVDVDRAYDYSGDTYDFFSSKFGRDSLDGAGLTLKSTVKYCPSASECPYENAYWNGAQMVYGAGFAAADDVVGHELSHGVTDFESHLFYYYQSGAINESLSDVFGELIDQGNGAGTDTAAVRWKMGEDLPSIGAIRDMANPPAFGDPDRMGSANYATATADQGGVHTNSGVNNKAAFLMTDGGTFNGRTVTALGADKTARIYYEAATDLITSAADYADLADALQQGCANLVGTSGITAGDCLEVTDAVLATEMDQPPPAAASATEAPTCGAGTSPTDLFADDLENTGSGNWASTTISGAQSWAYPQNPNAFAGFDATYATSGVVNLFGADRTTTSNSAIGRTADLVPPVGATTYLRFRHAFGLEKGYDGGRVEYSVTGGASWVDAGSLFTHNGYTANANAIGGNAFTGQSHGYYSSRLDLSSLAGQSVRFRFRLATDSSVGEYGWWIDDIRAYTCGATASAPGAPTIGTATAGNAQATLTWTAPASDGGSPVTGYVVTPYIGAAAQSAQTFNSTATSQAVTGLANGTTYTFTVAAKNAIGTGAASAASNAVTPSGATAPGAPTIGNALPGNGSVSLSWAAPGSNGGSAITGYVVTPSIGGTPQAPVTFNSTATTQNLTGLVNGTTYTFTVAAKNAVGTGAPSASSSPIAAGAPAVPGFPSAQPGDASAKVGFFAPGTNGSPLTGYVITPYLGAVAQAPQSFDASSTKVFVTGLANGSTYTFRIAAVNANGTGREAITNPVLVGAPAAPGFPNAVPGTTSVRLSWLAPAANAAPIQGYTVTPYIGSTAQPPVDFPGTGTYRTVNGLTTGTSYSFRIAAYNSVGASPEAVTGVVIAGAPSPPGFQVAIPGNGSAKVKFTPPAANAAPVERFTVWPVQGSTVLAPQVFETPSATILTVTGLTTGVAYSFRVAATNSVGMGPYAVTGAITVGTPTAPSFVSAQPGDASARVVWQAAADNGSPITAYVVTPYIGTIAMAPQTFASTATTQILVGLTNGTTYSFRVAAVNAVGTGPQDATWTPIRVGTPTSPNWPSVKPGDSSAVVSWQAPAANGSPITGYVITPLVGTTVLAPQTFASTATTQTVTGLTNGTTYTFRVAAINAVGTGPYTTVGPLKAGVPSAPAKPSAVAGPTSATVTWVAPAANGSAITGYLVTPIKAGVAQAAVPFDASATSRTIGGLTAGSSYTFTVTVLNAVGTGAASPASSAVVPTP
jgi:bacillolysin